MPMNRRALMQRAMVLLGAAALPGCKYMPGSQAPSTLSADRLKLLDAYADTLIPATDTPGALAAGVPGVLARMYTVWAADETRVELAGALDRIDAAAASAKGKGFLALTPAERQAFLAGHDKAALVDVPLPPGTRQTGNPFVPILSVVDNGYARLKELVATLYYASETALTRELAYEHVPGGWTASVKVTPQTRPAYTSGAF